MFSVLRICAFIVAVLPIVAMASVDDSRGQIINSREQNMLRSLHRAFSFPETPLPAGNAILTVKVNPATFDILVVGPANGNAYRYAEALEKWQHQNNLNEVVYFKQADDYAVAALHHSGGKFGLSEFEYDLHLPGLVQLVSNLEGTVHPALISPPGLNVDQGREPDFVSPSGTCYWILKGAGNEPKSMTVSASAPPGSIPLLAGWIIVPALICGAGLLTGFVLAKRSPLRRNHRRILFKRFATGGSIAGGTVHFVIFAIIVSGRKLDVLSYLWFGESFTGLGAASLVVVALPICFVAIFLPFAEQWAIEDNSCREGHYNLISPSNVRSAQSMRDRLAMLRTDSPDPAIDRIGFMRLCLILIFLGLLRFGNSGSKTVLTASLVCGAVLTATFCYEFWQNHRKKKNPTLLEMSELIASEIKPLAAVMGTNVPPLKVHPNFAGATMTISPLGELWFGTRFTLDIAPPERRFFYAAGLARWIWHRYSLRLYTASGFLAGIIGIPLVTQSSLPPEIRRPLTIILFVCVLACIAARSFLVPYLERRQRELFDDVSVQTVGREVALSALRQQCASAYKRPVTDDELFDDPILGLRAERIANQSPGAKPSDAGA